MLYHSLRTAPTKTEALRQAQMAMLQGQVSIQKGRLIFSNLGQEVELPSHPYYWATFTLIGTPW